MPQCSEEINRYFVGLVAAEYCKVAGEKGRARQLSSKSDSTDAADVQGSLMDMQEGMEQVLADIPSKYKVWYRPVGAG